MKLQLTPQVLRLRLTDTDMQEFARAGQLSHTVPIGSGFTYTLHQLPANDADRLRVRYEASAIVVEIPATQAQQLIAGATVSLKSEVTGTDGQLFRILVEKDLGPSH